MTISRLTNELQALKDVKEKEVYFIIFVYFKNIIVYENILYFLYRSNTFKCKRGKKKQKLEFMMRSKRLMKMSSNN